MSFGDRIQSRWDTMTTHPLQTLLGLGAGALVPGGGLVANRLFNYYNNNQFNNSADRLQQNITSQGQHAGNSFMDKPLDGPLGNVSGGQGNNSDLAQAFLGGGNQANSGNLNMYNQFGRNTQSYGSPNVGGLLDFLGQAPQGGPGGTFANGGPMNTGNMGLGGMGGFGQGSYGGLGNLGSLGTQAQLSGSTIGSNTVFGGVYGGSSPTGGGGSLKVPGHISKSKN